MTSNRTQISSPWQQFFGPNLGYIQELYEQYKQDPNSIDADMRAWFEKYGEPTSAHAASNMQGAALDPSFTKKVVDAAHLVWNIRTYGHMAAKIDPINLSRVEDTRLLEHTTYNLTREDLEAMPADLLWEDSAPHIQTGWDVYKSLRNIYTKTLTYQFSHVTNLEERAWLNGTVERQDFRLQMSNEDKVNLLRRLCQVESFEQFLHKTFVGQKRFSIEGLDALVPMLDQIVVSCIKNGTFNILMGMAHRGRLNVLTHVLNKPYRAIFSEFQSKKYDTYVGWTGDVKYHFGADHELDKDGDQKTDIRITLANNPSHLEFVDPIVEGYARAAQEDRTEPGFPKQNVMKALPVLIHGDAAFPGEGVVAETLNMSKLRGYHTGGAIHIIANNQLGFTTESSDSRSTKYASDLAKGFEIPIVHVNADDPEACLSAIKLAVDYRMKFGKDFVVDLIGYRRFGHNESDDPVPTQPKLYAKINNHPTVFNIYAQKLQEEGIVSEEAVNAMRDEIWQTLQNAYEDLKSGKKDVYHMPGGEQFPAELVEVDTAVDLAALKAINDNLLKWPDGFKVYPKLARILKRRENALEPGGQVDWAHAEALAFATILQEGTPIRMTGQDSERGTFAHRHLMLHDSETGEKFSPLHALPEAKASFAIHNSPLTETAVMGFEYGYNIFSPETMVLWEAQFGDFVNVAQVIIDQFLSAGRAKWAQRSSLVLLLPHGYEGQGPEHSSARLERFLQSAAENNWVVANVTNAAQYFHLLRRHAKSINKLGARPLILMTPKSLLRNPRASSVSEEFTNGRFKKIVEDVFQNDNLGRVKRLVMCSGKVAVDLQQALEDKSPEEREWLHIVRLEQLYPFPASDIAAVLQKLTGLEDLVWVQEEPKNMGAWAFVEPRMRDIAGGKFNIRYIGRPERASTAEGMASAHNIEQERIINEALQPMKHYVAEKVTQGGGRKRD